MACVRCGANYSLAGLIAVYMLGFFSFSTTVLRLYQAITFREVTDTVQRESKLTIFSIWSAIETNTALICANLPAVSALVKSSHSRRAARKRPKQLLNRISDTSSYDSNDTISSGICNEKFRDAHWNTRDKIEAHIEEGRPF